MRTHLLCTVPSVEPEPDTGRAVNDANYRIAGDVPATTATINHSGAVPIDAAAIREHEHYWLDGYAGI